MGVGASTEEECQSPEEDALASTGLACDSHKAIIETDVALLDESIILNMECL